MNSEKYIGLDVHQATICVAVMDPKGKVVMESILETKATTILEFLAGLRGTLSVTFEEGTWAAWLYDLLKPHVANLVVCNPRKNALLKHGNKSDKIDARKLADLLRLNDLEPVYHGETGVRMLRELARSYLTIVKDVSRVMSRLKAIYRSWAIPCAGRDVYYTRHRGEWLGKIPEAGSRRRAEQLYQQLDMLQPLRQQARRELLAESRKHTITAKLRQIPSLGPIRSALAVALIQTPHRFLPGGGVARHGGNLRVAAPALGSGSHELQRSPTQGPNANKAASGGIWGRDVLCPIQEPKWKSRLRKYSSHEAQKQAHDCDSHGSARRPRRHGCLRAGQVLAEIAERNRVLRLQGIRGLGCRLFLSD